jgi:hypothetical protein
MRTAAANPPGPHGISACDDRSGSAYAAPSAHANGHVSLAAPHRWYYLPLYARRATRRLSIGRRLLVRRGRVYTAQGSKWRHSLHPPQWGASRSVSALAALSGTSEGGWAAKQYFRTYFIEMRTHQALCSGSALPTADHRYANRQRCAHGRVPLHVPSACTLSALCNSHDCQACCASVVCCMLQLYVACCMLCVACCMFQCARAYWLHWFNILLSVACFLFVPCFLLHVASFAVLA